MAIARVKEIDASFVPRLQVREMQHLSTRQDVDRAYVLVVGRCNYSRLGCRSQTNMHQHNHSVFLSLKPAQHGPIHLFWGILLRKMASLGDRH